MVIILLLHLPNRFFCLFLRCRPGVEDGGCDRDDGEGNHADHLTSAVHYWRLPLLKKRGGVVLLDRTVYYICSIFPSVIGLSPGAYSYYYKVVIFLKGGLTA